MRLVLVEHLVPLHHYLEPCTFGLVEEPEINQREDPLRMAVVDRGIGTTFHGAAECRKPTDSKESLRAIPD